MIDISIRRRSAHTIQRIMYFQVEDSDETTKICENCVSGVHHFTQFRGTCAVTNNDMKRSQDLRNENNSAIIKEIVGTLGMAVKKRNASIGINLRNCSSSNDPPVAYISLIDDESDAEIDQADVSSELASGRRFALLDGELEANTMNLESIGFGT